MPVRCGNVLVDLPGQALEISFRDTPPLSGEGCHQVDQVLHSHRLAEGHADVAVVEGTQVDAPLSRRL